MWRTELFAVAVTAAASAWLRLQLALTLVPTHPTFERGF